jgi:ribosomal protein L4
VEGLNVYDVLRHKNVAVAQEALSAIVGRLSTEVANG